MAGVHGTQLGTWVDAAVTAVEGEIQEATWTRDQLAARRSNVWRLRVLGYSQTAIATELKIAQQTVSDDLKWCREHLPSVFETIVDFRNVSLARLEHLILKLLTNDQIAIGDQVRAVAGLVDLQAKLLGGYAPTKVDAAVTVDYQITGIDPKALT